MIISFCGLIGSGKDTAADYLCNFHHFRRESFASSLKDAVSVIFGWERELLEGRTKQSREWREQVDAWWSKRLNIPHLTPRWVLQYWGTEVCRHGFHDDIWVACIENKMRKITDNIVITDCRFPNEVAALKRQGGVVARIKRGMDPEWFQLAKNYPSKMADLYPDVHASEYSWAGTEFDVVIDNNGTVDHLYSEIRNLV